jgi:hypothetical protein
MKEEMLQMQKKMDVGNKQLIDQVFDTEETVKSPEVIQAEAEAEAEWQQWVSDEITDMMSSMSDEEIVPPVG